MSYSMGYGNFGGDEVAPPQVIADRDPPPPPPLSIFDKISNPQVTIYEGTITRKEEARRRALKAGVVPPINIVGPTEQAQAKKKSPIKLIIIGLAAIAAAVLLTKR